MSDVRDTCWNAARDGHDIGCEVVREQARTAAIAERLLAMTPERKLELIEEFAAFDIHLLSSADKEWA